MRNEISVSAIIVAHTGRMIFTIQRQDRWFCRNNQQCAYYTAVGGKLHPDEQFTACLMREVDEEISATVQLVNPVTQPLYISENSDTMHLSQLGELASQESIQPIVLYEMRIQTPEAGRSNRCFIPIYFGLLTDHRVIASDDISAIISFSLEELIQQQEGVSMAQLASNGQLISTNKRLEIPRDLIVFPFATPRLLANDTRFYHSVEVNSRHYLSQE